jgi:hypothetical protein
MRAATVRLPLHRHDSLQLLQTKVGANTLPLMQMRNTFWT